MRRLAEPASSPFGCPIPSRDADDGDHDRRARADGSVPLSDVVDDLASTVVVRWVPERLQTDRTLLANLWEIGALPGAELLASRDGEDHTTILLTGRNGTASMPADAVGALMVETRGR